jgi:hypothetical protein
LLETPMAGLEGTIPRRQIGPRRSGAQNPEHPVEHRAGIAKRPPTPIGPSFFPQKRFHDLPLLFREVSHALLHATGPLTRQLFTVKERL